MKYIRTKDGRIRFNITDGCLSPYTMYDVEKQADTIEELCDEFVCEHYISANTNDLRKLRPNGLIYGAIWTDKGLIYVAKMNDKGKLELI